jgi:hypothetical protein
MTDTETSDLNDEPDVPENRPTPKYPPSTTAPQVSPLGGVVSKVDYMEARIASMEAHVDHMRDDLGDMRRDYRELTKPIMTVGTDMREIDDRVGSLPGKGWMFLAMLLFTVIICAVIIYLEQIRQYLNVLPPTSGVP